MGAAIHAVDRWDTGHQKAGRRALFGLAAIVLVVALLAVVQANRADETQLTLAPSAGPEATWSSDGTAPSEFPDERHGLAWFAYGQPVDVVSSELGEVEPVADDLTMWGPAKRYTWQPAEGATLEVASYDVPGSRIDDVSLQLTPTSQARFALWDGLVAGSSTIGDVLEVWGEPIATDEPPDGTLVRKYSTCVRSEPVGVFFSAPKTASPADRFTGVWIGLLDEPNC